ncbi:TonB-dependent receptor [Pseudoduganella sp. RAF19]|uniref:TonB-dependent receptor n=1 Tax=Pseudoduganella sp. RAF19 TaxID=3233052 RepID=UPI003F95F755
MASKLAVLISSIMSGAALAQEAYIPEVVVTAQRTAAPQSKTPIAMSVISGEQLTNGGLDSPSNIAARLPNTYLENANDGLKITIRGVSNADTTEKGDPSAAFMMDGVYIARPQIQNLAFYDLQRVEVLRGPQGTLYGRNATAGVINVISNAPGRQMEATVGLELGNYASRKASAMFNLPVNDMLALRLAAAYNKHDAYLINGSGDGRSLGNDRDDLSVRLSAKLELNKAASLLLRYDHSKVDDNPDNIVPDTNFYHGVITGQPVWYGSGTDTQLTNAFVPPNVRPDQAFSHKKTNGISAEANRDFGPATLTYVGSHRSFDHEFLTNYYYRAIPTFPIGVRQSFDADYAQNSHELRIATNGSGPLSAQAGLYYFREWSDQLYTFRDLQLLGLTPYYVFPHGPTIARSKAAFGQATYRVMDGLRLTAGARYTEDHKSRVGSTNFQQGPVFNPSTDLRFLNAATLDTHKTTWRLGAEYDFNPATLLYASVATGYKAGGFNDGCQAGTSALGIPCPAPVAVAASTLYYQPEELKSWEAGVKSRFWNKRASLNASVFYYDYTNLQVSGVDVIMGAPQFVTKNAAVAAVRGIEADGVIQPTKADRISYGLTLLDAHYRSYTPDGIHSLAGTRLDRAPAHTFTLGYEHAFQLPVGELTAGAVARRSAAYEIGVPTKLLHYHIPSRTQSDLQLGYRPDNANWSLHAYVKNVEDKVQPIAIDSFGMIVPSDPRTFGLRFDYRL